MQLEEGCSMIRKFIVSIKYLNVKDIFDIICLPFIVLCSLIYKIYLKIKKRKIWLISEGKNDARDNGYVFFEYIRKNHPDDYVYYAINKKCESYEKVNKLGNTVNYGGFKHWIYYLNADKNIIIHKAANPNEKIFYVLHYYRLFNGHRIFLQHGVTMNYVKYLTYKETNFELFISGAKPEYEYIKSNFGYPSNNVCYLGFPRFDRLYNAIPNKNIIAVMPTWRTWLKDIKKSSQFKKSGYYKKYQSLLNNETLINFLDKNDIKLFFYLHKNVEKFASLFTTKCSNIIIVKSNMDIILKLISESSVLITDYSSVSIDGAFMQKPIIYYQFDVDKFRKHHLEKGYFSYENDGFGPVVLDEENLVENIIKYKKNNYKVEDKYVKRSNSFFELRDNDNCKRIYEKLVQKNN